ncbi:MAG: Folate-dependent phosphoribosylglycinamide formyltransferase PurN [Chloroflexi bacterium]|jgi:phosphoribosylglycinamide formyltransferase-1|nr:MAG: Folate-dependent phosphoribosylglycinamide formyltransferase PurN [Chloroflexota bacterium]
MLRLGWFSTGRGEGSMGMLRTTVEAMRAGDLDAQIEFVFSNRELGEAEGSDRYFQQVRDYGIPLVCCSSRRFRKEHGTRVSEDREAFDREVVALLEEFQPDLCVMAGYMLILSPLLCNRFSLINLHPALPDGPAGTWQQVIWDLIAQRAPASGAMVHLVTEIVDDGPPLSYVRFPIQGNEFNAEWDEVESKTVEQLQQDPGEQLALFNRIRQEGVRRERPLLLETLKALANNRLRIEGRSVIADSEEPPLCLNDQVELGLENQG